jgi:hypothetical protein
VQERPRRQHLYQQQRHAEGRCFREGCKNLTATPEAWRCPQHAAEHMQYMRDKRAKSAAAKPSYGNCACGASPLVRTKKCSYYKSEEHYFPAREASDAG